VVGAAAARKISRAFFCPEAEFAAIKAGDQVHVGVTGLPAPLERA